MNKHLPVILVLLPLAASAQVSQNLSLQPGPVITLQAGANMSALAIADFNSDNRSDVAVCQRGLNSVAVYLQSNGVYPASPNGTYATATSPTGLVATTLTNTISRPLYDLVAVSGPSSTWTLLQNTSNGQGTFTPVAAASSFGSSSISTAPTLQTAFLNADNYADFAYTYDAPGQRGIIWAAYYGSGIAFQPGGYINTGSYTPPTFAMTDFDRDGYTDAVYPNPGSDEVRVIFASHNGTSPYWSGSNLETVLTTGFSQPMDVATGDVNRDLLPDIAVANAGSSSITVVPSIGNYLFSSPALYPLSAAPRRVLLQDLNGDGYPELLTITADNKLQVFRHTGSTGAARYGTPITLATGVDPTMLQVADMDGDLQADVIVGCPSDNTVHIYLNRSQSGLATASPQLANVNVFPNPTTDLLRVEASGLHEPLRATLLDVTGRTVREATLLTTDCTLPVADLPRGLYLLRLTTADASRVWHVELQ